MRFTNKEFYVRKAATHRSVGVAEVGADNIGESSKPSRFLTLLGHGF